MTSVTSPRSSSSRVRSSTTHTSGRRCSTSWPYHSGVEYDHHDSTTALGSSAVNISSSQAWTQVGRFWSAIRQRDWIWVAVGTSSATPTTSATTAASTPDAAAATGWTLRPAARPRALRTGPNRAAIASATAPPRIASHVQAKNTGPM